MYIGRFRDGDYFFTQHKLEKIQFTVHAEPKYTIMDFWADSDKMVIVRQHEFERAFPDIHVEIGDLVEV